VTPRLILHGPPAARGEAYGEAARTLIVEAAGRWHDRAGERAPRLLDALVDGSGFLATVRRCTPGLADEVEGMARAANVDRRVAWTLNLLGESWWSSRTLADALADTDDAGDTGCSAFGVEGEASVLAQTMDLPPHLDGLQVLLDIDEGDGAPRVLAPAYAGIVATNAMNERGVGVCVNTLNQLPTSRTGLPVAFLIRFLARQPTLDAALAVLHDVPHASGQNYLVGEPGRIADLECGAGTVVERAPVRHRLVHTNHPLGAPPPATAGVVSSSGERLAALERAVMEPDRPPDADTAESILRDPVLCRDADDALTFYAVVMELTDEPALRLSSGPPSRSPYERYVVAG
jgi:isopenicillin-N N-acyltransferase like protein